MCFKYALTAVKMTAASTRRKRKRVVLSLENKLSILNRLAKGEKGTKVASEFGIGNSMVTDLKKKESRIRLLVSSMESLSVRSKERKIIRLANDEKVDEAVYKLIFHISAYLKQCWPQQFRICKDPLYKASRRISAASIHYSRAIILLIIVCVQCTAVSLLNSAQ